MGDKTLNVYGAKLSENGNYIIVTLVEGKDKERTFYHTLIALDDSRKTKGEVVDDKAVITIPLLKPAKKEPTLEDVDKIDDDLPF